MPRCACQSPTPRGLRVLEKRRYGAPNSALFVGNYATKVKRISKEALYLEEYDTELQATGGEASPPGLGEIRLNNGTRTSTPSWIEGPLYVTCLYGKASKNEEKFQERYQGLFYTTDDDVKMNTKIMNARGFKGNEIIGKLTENGFVNPFTDTIRALYRSFLVYCGQKTSFEEFENPNGNIQGEEILVCGLRKIAKRSEVVEVQTEDHEPLEEVASDEDSPPFMAEGKGKSNGRGKNRALDMGDAEVMPAKKPRMD